MNTLALVAALLVSQAIPGEPQRPGDPKRGYDALVNAGYVRCGVPLGLYAQTVGYASPGIPGRRGVNAKLPYYVTATTGHAGGTVVGANCLGCHAGWMRGELVVGMGEAGLDQTFRVAPVSPVGSLLKWVLPSQDRSNFGHFLDTLDTAEPSTVTDTVGVSSADKLAAILMSHRNPETLAWTGRPSFKVPRELAPVKVPAWWLMRRKTTMFFTGAGRGDHARLMMATALFCTGDVKEAEDIDKDFGDIRAYITSLRAPPYPFPVDAALAARGASVYEQRCRKCHGSADSDGPYPNLIVAAKSVGTDPLLSEQNRGAEGEREWFAKSFFGRTARLEATDGYVAPPMDGVWARAPYFHNGSVPTLEGVLDSAERPRVWARSPRYDPDAVGWRYHRLRAKDGSKWAYDTSRPGYGNGGHLYGDALEPGDRRALLEFLKSL